MGDVIDKKLIVFESNPDFSDNSRGLWEYIVKNTDYETFWVVRNKKMLNLLQERGIACGADDSELAKEMIEKAGFLVTSSFEFAYSKKSGQVHVAAWHGFPLKVIGFFDSAAASEESFEGLKTITTQTDIITASSRLSQLTLSGLFAVDPRKVKETGFPRNDIMFQTDGRKELSKITDIDIKNSKLIFYLPTMRKGLKDEGKGFENNIFNYPDWNADAIDDFLESQNAYVFTKMHFADNKFFSEENFKLPKRMVFLDTYALNKHFLTIYHIMNAFDVLITDYSSVYVDFLLLNRPIIFSCPDLEEYQKDRGFIVDDPSVLMPGAIVKTQEQLLKNLQCILNGCDSFQAIREEKMPFFHGYKDGDSAKRVFEEMIKVSESGGKDSAKEMANLYLNCNSPLAQYVKRAKAEIFFDTGNGFNESGKCIKEYNIKESDEKIQFEIEIPTNANFVRFDPDNLGRCVLKNLKIYLNNIESSYEVVNGSELGDSIFFENDDPQVIVNLECGVYEKIRIEYNYVDLYSNAGKIINTLNRKLEEIESSYWWKMTGLLRIFERGMKKVKHKLKKI